MTALQLIAFFAGLSLAWGQRDQPSLHDFLASEAQGRREQLFRIQDRPLDGDELAYLRSAGYDLTREGLVLDPVEHKPLSKAQAESVLKLVPDRRKSQAQRDRRTLNEVDFLDLKGSDWGRSVLAEEQAWFLALVRELEAVKGGDPDAAGRLRALLDSPDREGRQP